MPRSAIKYPRDCEEVKNQETTRYTFLFDFQTHGYTNNTPRSDILFLLAHPSLSNTATVHSSRQCLIVKIWKVKIVLYCTVFCRIQCQYMYIVNIGKNITPSKIVIQTILFIYSYVFTRFVKSGKQGYINTPCTIFLQVVFIWFKWLHGKSRVHVRSRSIYSISMSYLALICSIFMYIP